MIAAALLSLAAAVAAPEPAPDLHADGRWLEAVEPLLLPDERETYRALDPRDRAVFEEIFWARRRPGAAADLAVRREAADRRFRRADRRGSDSDCGRMLVLLGPADHEDGPDARGVRVWTWVDRPGLRFSGGRLSVRFDRDCAAMSPDFAQLRARLAERWLVEAPPGYRLRDGRLEPLLAAPANAAAALLGSREPGADSTLDVWTLPAEGGEVVLLGLHALAGGGATNGLAAAARALRPDGTTAASWARAGLTADTPAAAFRLTLAPGPWHIESAVVEESSGRAAVARRDLSIPADPAPGLRLGLMPLAALDRDTALAPGHALGALVVGAVRLGPRAGNRFGRDEELLLFYTVCDPAVDGRGRARIEASVRLEQAGTVLAETRAEPLDLDPAGRRCAIAATAGPYRLSRFSPGPARARLVVRDVVAGTSRSLETGFAVGEPSTR